MATAAASTASLAAALAVAACALRAALVAALSSVSLSGTARSGTASSTAASGAAPRPQEGWPRRRSSASSPRSASAQALLQSGSSLVKGSELQSRVFEVEEEEAEVAGQAKAGLRALQRNAAVEIKRRLLEDACDDRAGSGSGGDVPD